MIPIKQKVFLNFAFMLVICLVCIFAKVRAAGSDPMGTLLVSQAIVQHGTIRLDAYENVLSNYTYRIQQKNNHYYYFFPLGTSVFAVPAVALANALGLDMITQESRTQAALALLLALANYLLLRQIARLYLSPARSSCAAIIFWLGTSYASTSATALWSHDLAVFFSTAAIYPLLRVKFQLDIGRPILMGFCLFAAYFCRPTLSLLIPIYLIASATVSHRLAIKVALVSLIFLMVFVAFSFYEFHQPLPDYYLPQRLVGETFWVALYGNLLSPARGLLIYSPFFVLPIAWVVYSRKAWAQAKVEIILAIWPIFHLVAISQFPHWWAGASYGSRLMVDALPGLFVLLLCYLAQASGALTQRWIFFVGLGAVAIWINAYQGLFNRSTAEWNVQPSIDECPEGLFDWRYPQFLSTPARLKQRMAQHEINVRELEAHPPVALIEAMNADLAVLNRRAVNESEIYAALLRQSPLVVSTDYDFRSSNLYFIGWGATESLFRWSEGYHAEILFYLEPDSRTPTSIAITAFALHPQRFRLILNGNFLGNFDIGTAEQELSIKVDSQYFHSSAINTLHFELPAARKPVNGDSRILALAFQKIRISD